jgi:hypothetical protein
MYTYRYITVVLEQEDKEVKYQDGQTVYLRLNGDGFNLGTTRSAVLLAFASLSANPAVVHQQRNIHTLGLYDGTEKGAEMNGAFQTLLTELRGAQSDGVVVNGKKLAIRFFLSGDWKFLAYALGIVSVVRC